MIFRGRKPFSFGRGKFFHWRRDIFSPMVQIATLPRTPLPLHKKSKKCYVFIQLLTLLGPGGGPEGPPPKRFRLLLLNAYKY